MSKTTLADLRVKHRHVAGGHIFDPATPEDLIEAVESIGGEIRYRPDGTRLLMLVLEPPKPVEPSVPGEWEVPDDE